MGFCFSVVLSSENSELDAVRSEAGPSYDFSSQQKPPTDEFSMTRNFDLYMASDEFRVFRRRVHSTTHLSNRVAEGTHKIEGSFYLQAEETVMYTQSMSVSTVPHNSKKHGSKVPGRMTSAFSGKRAKYTGPPIDFESYLASGALKRLKGGASRADPLTFPRSLPLSLRHCHGLQAPSLPKGPRLPNNTKASPIKPKKISKGEDEKDFDDGDNEKDEFAEGEDEDDVNSGTAHAAHHQQQPSIESVMSDISAYRSATSGTPPVVSESVASENTRFPTRKLKIPKGEFGLTEMLAVIEAKAMLLATPPPPPLDDVDRLLFGAKIDVGSVHPQIREIYAGTFKKMDEIDSELDILLQKTMHLF